MKILALVLAAGKGTRMNSELPKVLHKVNGVPMLQKVLNVLSKAGVEKSISILGHKKEKVLEDLGELDHVLQLEQLGTGHAVMQADSKLKDFKGTVMILCGDTPLLRSETLSKLLKRHEKEDASCTVLTTEFLNPSGYGRIVKDENGQVKAIVEEKEASEEIKKIKEINTGVYCFKSEALSRGLKSIDNKNSKGEYYLTDVVKIFEENGEKVESYKIDDNSEVLGVNNRVHLHEASEILRKRKNLELMESGVTIINLESTYIEEEVEVGIDTIIYPGTFLEGKTKIASNVKIMENSRIENSIIEDNVLIQSSIIEDSIVREGAKIGPYAHLRPKSDIGKNSKVGNFVEIKKSVLHEGVKAGHLTYIGDSIVGEETNIGAGTITCNYDGKNKFKTEIGKKVFVGSNTKFVAPVKIGNNSFIAAGSVITKEVPDDALAFGRARQINKKGWVK